MNDIRETGRVKVSGDLVFDPVRNAPLLEEIWRMTRKGKTSTFSSYVKLLIEAAMENPETITRNRDYLRELATKGGTPKFEEFYSEAREEIKEMHRKIDYVYETCRNLQLMVSAGKVFGLEKKIESTALVEFVAEKELKDLVAKYGISDINVYKRNQQPNIEDISESVMKYMIEHYSNLIDILVQNQSNSQIVSSMQVENKNEPNIVENTTINNSAHDESNNKTSVEKIDEKLIGGDDDEEIPLGPEVTVEPKVMEDIFDIMKDL